MGGKRTLATLLKSDLTELIPRRRVPVGPGDGPRLTADVRQSLQMQDIKMPSAFDFAPFRRSTVGFDRLFDLLENSASGQTHDNYGRSGRG